MSTLSSELNEIVYDGTFSKNRIPKELLPAATTIYTPDWAIRYMVDNSLGKMFVKEYPQIKRLLKYYIDSEPVENTVKIEDVKFLDPCMGSGHILVYAFDVLYQAYLSQGYGEREIPDIILKNNIFGLDIDERACQLAYFALMMKARSCNRRFFRRDPAEIPQPQVYATTIDCGIATYRFNMGDFLLDKTLNTKHQETLDYLITTFQEIEEYGSIIKLENRDYKGLLDAWNNYASATTENFNLTLWFAAMEKVVPDLIAKSIVLTQKYDVVVTNPPYLGSGRFSPKLLEYVNANYPDAKSDLSMVMYKHALQDLSKRDGYVAFITTSSWMYLSSFEKLRKYVLENFDFDSLVDFGSELFDGKVGHNLIAAWVNRNSRTHGPMTAIRLVDYCYGRRDEKEPEFFNPANRHIALADNFAIIPGCPVAYWASKNTFNIFSNKSVDDYEAPRFGMSTSDNERFVRTWFEVSFKNFALPTSSYDKVFKDKKWYPYNNGGEFRRWYGNNVDVVNWENDGAEIKAFSRAAIRNKSFYLQKGITWTAISSGKIAVRAFEYGYLFSSAGFCIFDNNYLKYTLCILNSCVGKYLLGILSPTMNYNVGDIARIPIVNDIKRIEIIEDYAEQNIALSRADWDSFETSWDFKAHPLVRYKIIAGFENHAYSGTIEQAYNWWAKNAERQFNRLKANEEELNRIFIDIYGLQDELTPEVEDKDVTVRKADLGRDIRSFISYAVGCMFGRYSLDEPGLVFAGGQFDMSRYKTFMPEDDNIIPIGSADYFDDDIVVRFIEFVRVVYGDNTLGENLSFIADALYPNGNGSAQERIRRYFLNDFYKDHVKIYQKRPIYWLMDSGKKDGFKALFYLHRYDKYTVARARTDYLHPLQRKYEARIKQLEMLSGSTENAREKATYRKEIDALLNKIDECRVYDQVVSHIAHQQIELDLDDGVKVNYEKFQGVDVPMDNGKTVKMDLLGRI